LVHELGRFMAGTFLGKYDTAAANNTATGTGSVSVAEGMLPSNINNAFRSIMADIRQHYNVAEWIEYGDGAGAYTPAYVSGTSFTIAGVNVTAIYHVGRRVKVTASTPGTIYGTITATAFSSNTTVTVAWDSGSLSNEAITNVLIGALSKTNSSIPVAGIATANIVDGAVVIAKIGADAVDGTKIADDAIDSEHYTNGSIDTAHIAADQIVASLIADNAIDSEHYTDGSIDNAHIADDAIDSEHYAAGSIDTAHIAADQITNAKIADDQIDSEHYVDGSIDTAHIADANVTNAKLAATLQVGKQTIWVPSNAMTPTESNGAARATVETTSGRPDMQVLDFDKDSDEFAQFSIAFPKQYNLGTVTFQFFWSGLAATTGVSMSLEAVAMNDNETIDVAYGTAVVVDDDAQGAVEELLVSAESGAITIAGTPADNDLTYFRVGRDVSDSNDDMAGDCRLHGIKIFFTTDAANDA